MEAWDKRLVKIQHEGGSRDKEIYMHALWHRWDSYRGSGSRRWWHPMQDLGWKMIHTVTGRTTDMRKMMMT